MTLSFLRPVCLGRGVGVGVRCSLTGAPLDGAPEQGGSGETGWVGRPEHLPARGRCSAESRLTPAEDQRWRSGSAAPPVGLRGNELPPAFHFSRPSLDWIDFTVSFLWRQ